MTGVSTKEDYVQMLKEKFENSATEVEVKYDKNAKPQTPLDKQPGNPGEVAKEDDEAASQLRKELKEYKIYFGSGKKLS